LLATALCSDCSLFEPGCGKIAIFCDADSTTSLACLPQFTSAARPAKYEPMTSADYKAMRLGAQTAV